MVILGVWNPNLASFSQSEVVISIEIQVLYRAMKLHGFLYLFCISHIKNESKVDEIDIKIKNQIGSNLVGNEWKVIELGSFWIDLGHMQNLHHLSSAHLQDLNYDVYIILDISEYTSEAAHQ